MLREIVPKYVTQRPRIERIASCKGGKTTQEPR